jgi:hypothetical protein
VLADGQLSAAVAAAAAAALQMSQHVLQFFRDSPLFLEYNCSTPLQPSSSSSSSRKASNRDKWLSSSPIPLCMEVLSEALATNPCAMLTVLGPAAAAAAAHDRATDDATAGQDVATELLLQRLGCDVFTASPDQEPPAALQALLRLSKGSGSSSSSSSSTSNSRNNLHDSGAASAAAGAGQYRHIQVVSDTQVGSTIAEAANAQQDGAVPLLSLLQQNPWDLPWQQLEQQQADEQQQEQQQQQQVGDQQQQHVDEQQQQQQQQDNNQQEGQGQRQAEQEQDSQPPSAAGAPQQLQQRR